MAYYDDAGTSRATLLEVVDTMRAEGRITDADAALGRADIEAAYAASDAAAFFGYDARTFWTTLAERVNANGRSYAAWGGGTRTPGKRSPGEAYAATVLSGLTAYDSARATDYAASWSAFWTDVVVQSSADYAQAAQTVGKAAINPWYIGAVAALVLGLVVLKGRR